MSTSYEADIVAWANEQAANETGLDCFPEDCPWSIEAEVLKEGWLPDA